MKNIHVHMRLLIENYGPWTAHNILLSNGITTMPGTLNQRYLHRAYLYHHLYKTWSQFRLRPFFRRPTVLDIGCLEGGIAIYFASMGFNTVGIDIRESNLKKADFASKALGLQHKCKWICGDVCDSKLWSSLGKFDLILCGGLLYHLDAPNIPFLVEHMSRKLKSSGLTVVDTNYVDKPSKIIEADNGLKLHGHDWIEHAENDTLTERLPRAWSSLTINKAFWLTERSLCNVLVSYGFTDVIKPMYPYHEWGHKCRDVYLCRVSSSPSYLPPLRVEPDTRETEHPGLK